MRTLPSSEPVQGRGSDAASTLSRAWALGLLLATVVVGGGLGAASGNPEHTARWAYRALIRVRGGTFVAFPDALLQSGLSDCGPVALATLITSMGGSPPSADSIGTLAGTGARGTTFGGLLRAAHYLGVHAALRRLDPAAMEELTSPVVAWVDRRHFVTVVPDSGRTVLVLDPEAGPYRVTRARLRRFWSGEALVPTPERHRAHPAAFHASHGGQP